MILGTVLSSKPAKTSFGLEYRIQFDENPEACAQSGCDGPAIYTGGIDNLYRQGDRVVLEYRSSCYYGLWFIMRKVGLGI